MFEALGQAPIVAGDRVRARERALDEALRQAVEQATATVLEPTELVARASDLKLRIYPKAKAYVATYRILDEGEQPPGTFQVHLSAAVATARLARDLSTSTGQPAPYGGRARRARWCAPASSATASTRRPPRKRRCARSWSRATSSRMPGATAVRRGRGRRRGARGGAQAALDGRGAGDAGRRHPRHHASSAPTRARQRQARRARRARLGRRRRRARRLRAVARRRRHGGDARRGGRSGARHRVGAGAALVEGDAGPAGGVTVRVRGVERWAEYQALTRALASLPGVAAVEPRRFVRGEIDLARAHRLGGVAAGRHTSRGVPPQGVRIGVRAVGDAVEIDVAGEAAERG